MNDQNIFYTEGCKKRYIVPKDNEFVEEDVFNFNQKNQEYLGLTLPGRKISGWFIAVIIFFLIIIVKLGYLQIIKGDQYLSIAEGNRIRNLEIKASRGLFYDRNGEILVKNTPNYLLEITPVDLPKNAEFEKLTNEISAILYQPPEIIKNFIESTNQYSYEPVIIHENLSHEQAIMTKILGNRYSAISLGIGTQRQYNNQASPSISHILGYTGKLTDEELEADQENNYSVSDYIGKVGLESFYEENLRGIKGMEQIEVDALGQRKEVLAYKEAVAGNDIVLSLNLKLQSYLENALAEALKKNKKVKGSAIVLNPENGEVLAMVSLPAFNNNDFAKGISEASFSELLNNPDKLLFNRSVSGLYPPGSTIKLIVAGAGLEEGVITPQTSFLSTGGIKVDKWFFPDWKSGGHGNTNVTRAISESINTFFYIVGGGRDNFKGLGIEKLIKYYSLAGIGSKLGIDLPNEASGILPTPAWKKEAKNEIWYIGDTYHISIGQGDVLVTPLQVAAWTSLVANGGTLYKPHIVKKIINYYNNKTYEQAPMIIRNNFIKAENVNVVKRGMRDAVTSGSARGLSDLSIKVAGKTGTAQWSTTKEPHAWFTGFAPYDNPEIVITILLEESGEGSQWAVPIAHDVIKWWSENIKNK